MIHTVLVPLDGSPLGEHALAPAIGVARRTGAALRLALVHEPVIPPPPSQPAMFVIDSVPTTPLMDPRLNEERRTQADSYLEAVSQRIIARNPGIDVAAMVLDAPVAGSLIMHAQEIAADLAVMTTHGRDGLRRLLLGSIAENLVRQASFPVLLVKPENSAESDAIGPSEFRRVLVALDGSSLAEGVLDTTLDVAGNAAELTLVRVMQPIAAVSVASLGGVEAQPGDVDGETSEVGAYLESLAERLRARNVAADTRAITHTRTADAILGHAREIRADLIAMGTHGRSGLRRLIMGSVAEEVLRDADVAVLLFRPGPE